MESRGLEEGGVPTAGAAGCPSESGLAGRASQCEGCPGKALCQAMGGADPDLELIKLRMNAIKHKLLVVSGKGGVGKSSVAAHLAMALASPPEDSNLPLGTTPPVTPSPAGPKTGIVDLDICGPSIPKLLAVESQSVVNSQYGWKPLVSPHRGIRVMSVGSLLDSQSSSVVFRGPRKTQLIKRFLKDTFWGRLDYLICDTPPGTSDEHLTVVKALRDANPDGAVIVTTPQEVALATIRKEINFCRKMGVRILGVVENMRGFVCPCCGEVTELFPARGVEVLCEEYSLRYLGRLPLDPELTVCCEKGNALPSESPSGLAFRELATSLKEILASRTYTH